MTTGSEPSRNIDELKRLVITALDKNGVLAELRSTVKLHVTRAINEDAHSPLSHPRNPRVSSLMSTDRGQLLTELIVEFLRFYDLKDTLSMLLVEAGVPRLRPSEAELSNQCGFTYQPTVELSVLEQYLTRQPQVNYAPHHNLGESEFDIHAESVSPTKDELEPVAPIIATPDMVDANDTSLVGVNTSLESDMQQMRNISRHMERIGRLEPPEELSPRYDEDEFEAASVSSSGQVETVSAALVHDDFDESPMPASRKGNGSMNSLMDDEVLFESRESLRNLGESPASVNPIDKNAHIERLERSSA